MSIDWFRSWHGAPTDAKWLVIGKRADVPPYAVSAFMWSILDHASQAEPRGEVSGFDFETYSAVSGMDEDKAKAIFAALEAKGIIVSGRIAQWEKRQPKREDPSSTERGRKARTKEPAPELPLDVPAAESVPPAPESFPRESEPAHVATATAPEVLITPQAIALSNKITAAAGHDLEFIPQSWAGAAYRVQTWLNRGWPEPIILESATAQLARKRDGPPSSISYLEKGIADVVARTASPLPTVVPLAEARQARHGKPQSSIMAAFDRLEADFERGSDPPRADSSRLLSDGRRE